MVKEKGERGLTAGVEVEAESREVREEALCKLSARREREAAAAAVDPAVPGREDDLLLCPAFGSFAEGGADAKAGVMGDGSGLVEALARPSFLLSFLGGLGGGAEGFCFGLVFSGSACFESSLISSGSVVSGVGSFSVTVAKTGPGASLRRREDLPPSPSSSRSCFVRSSC